jgi:hypothetical protein
MILMGIFNYIDTFFFISLGITFILILLLVFHFKQRMSDLENKTETMFEIINNIVKEITAIKQTSISNSCCENKLYTKPYCEERLPAVDNNKILVSDDEDDESDEGESDEGESDEGDSDEDEHPSIQITENTVKIISVDMGDVIEIEEPTVTEDNDYEEESTLENVHLDELRVEKVEESGQSEDNIVITESNTAETTKEIYRKMTLPALKTLVITKGLSTDPSKLKKNDLLKLLESE